MPLHFQTISRIFGVAARQIVRYNRYESKLFERAYRGVPRDIARGARHGYVGGSVVGSLISNPADDLSNGVPTGSKPQTYKQRKTYSGKQRYSSGKYKYNSRQYYSRCRHIRPRFKRRMSYR